MPGLLVSIKVKFIKGEEKKKGKDTMGVKRGGRKREGRGGGEGGQGWRMRRRPQKPWLSLCLNGFAFLSPVPFSSPQARK